MANTDHQTAVYALTSDGRDVFADMTRVSLASLRLTNPNIHVVLVCDAQTAEALHGSTQHPVVSEVDRVIAVPTPDGPSTFRNRYVKTALRQAVSGPFVYLDSDTLIRADIREIFSGPSSVRGVPNHSGSGSPEEMPGDEREAFEIMAGNRWRVIGDRPRFSCEPPAQAAKNTMRKKPWSVPGCYCG